MKFVTPTVNLVGCVIVRTETTNGENKCFTDIYANSPDGRHYHLRGYDTDDIEVDELTDEEYNKVIFNC